MSTYTNLTDLFTATANAIRAKTGSEATIKADDFPTEITNIQTGGDASIELTHDNDWRITGVKLINFTEIPTLLFSANPYLTTVDLSECPDLLSTGNAAFSGCSGLTSVTLPSNLEELGQETFLNCTSLTSITLPASLKRIAGYVFQGCSNLASITIPEACEKIHIQAFCDCSGLTTLRIPAGCNIEGFYVFKNCSGLQTIELAGNIVLSKSPGTFYGCSSLQKVWIRDTCEQIAASGAKSAPFGRIGHSNLEIYCESASAKPNWQTYWNYCGTQGETQVTPVWNQTTCPWATA